MTSSTRARARHRPAPWWLAALVGVPLILGFVGAQSVRGSIQDDLTTRARQVVQGVGAEGEVTFDGRDADVRLTSGDAGQVRSEISKLSGVRSVSVREARP